MARLTDRYQVNVLLPEDAFRAELLRQIDRVCPGGSTCHVLRHIPEQGEDVYTILIDDHTVVSFDAPRGGGPLVLAEVTIQAIADYRNQIGQGKERIRLNRAVEQARQMINKGRV
ncbi:hypothetical protein [Bradyrhizobium sp. SZCCHNR1051]|uniref:hypothetical protein n=1 Tax=Bradyrhizobium sp. SZCCHNR1051 TaxID=3057355 RepID=UPI00291652DB|nr:hypothetical protein [Bradyrhizobium sp. SZCCHNR1051]